MNELRALGREGDIADFVDRPPHGLSPESVSGVSLRLDDYWLNWYLRAYWAPRYWGGAAVGGVAWPSQRDLRTHFGVVYDFNAKPPDWDNYCKQRGMHEGAHPVSIVVILRQPLRGGRPESWPTSVGSHFVLYEHRPEAIAHTVRGGNAIHGLSSGTLGGYLWTSHDGRYFAISCAHVVGPMNAATVYASGLNAMGAARVHVGGVIESVFPPTVGGKCNNRIQPGLNGVDAAVIDLSGNPSIDLTQPVAGKVSRSTPIGQIGSGDHVTFTGATSGTVNAKVKECNIWKDITVGGRSVCFGDLLVLEDVVFNYVASALSKPGDSGAWVISTQGGVSSWDAMLIGGDGTNSYCAYAENVLATLDPNLRMPP